MEIQRGKTAKEKDTQRENKKGVETGKIKIQRVIERKKEM